MERGKNNSAEFMLILCSCSCEQKRRIQRSIVDLLISENKYAECIIELLDNNEVLFSTGEIDGNTTSAFPFNVNAEDADSYIIETAAKLRGTSFVFGLVDPEDK